MWQGNTKADPTQIQRYLQGMKLESAKEMTPAEAQAIYTAINKDWNPWNPGCLSGTPDVKAISDKNWNLWIHLLLLNHMSN